MNRRAFLDFSLAAAATVASVGVGGYAIARNERRQRAHASPFDLRPQVRQITDAIHQTHRQTQSSADKPLVVLVGEYHDMPSHKIVQLMLLKSLLSSAGPSALAVGLEHSHNFLEFMMRHRMNIDVPPVVHGKVSAADRTGQRTLESALAYADPVMAPVSTHTFFDFCLSQNIRTRFHDAAMSEALDYLDVTDRATESLVQKNSSGPFPRKIDPLQVEGVKLRNIMIADRAVAHIRETRAPIYVQICGMLHLLGDSRWGMDYRDSLTARFEAAGMHVMPVILHPGAKDRSLATFPAAAAAALTRSLHIHALPRHRISMDTLDILSLQEVSLVRSMRRESSAAFDVFDATGGSAARRAAMKDQMRKDAPHWVAAAMRAELKEELHGLAPRPVTY